MTANPVALITGASGRIGAELARTLHSLQYRIIIHHRSGKEAAEALVQELNQQRPQSAVRLCADMTEAAQLDALANDTLATWSRLDVLVNNASAFYPTPFGQANAQQWDDLMGSNVKAPYLLAQRLLPALKETQGQIINLIDIYAERPLPRHSLYCMSKAALAMMTKSLAQELAPGVRVNGIAPGAILWPESEPDTVQAQELLSKVPLGRLGGPQAIAEALRYLLHAHYVTGQILSVDGGRSLNM